MIAKSNWFSIRKWGGWGLTPATWQGWLYIVIAILPPIFIKNRIFVYSWIALLVVDLIDVFFRIRKDERDILHEALAERNALWIIIMVLIVGSLWKQVIDPVILAALGLGALTKTITYWHLRDK